MSFSTTLNPSQLPILWPTKPLTTVSTGSYNTTEPSAMASGTEKLHTGDSSTESSVDKPLKNTTPSHYYVNVFPVDPSNPQPADTLEFMRAKFSFDRIVVQEMEEVARMNRAKKD